MHGIDYSHTRKRGETDNIIVSPMTGAENNYDSLPPSFAKAAAKIQLAEDAGGCSAHCKSFVWYYLSIVALIIFCVFVTRGILFILLLVVLGLVVTRTCFRFQEWSEKQRIDNPDDEEEVVERAYKVENEGILSPSLNNSNNSIIMTTLGLCFDDDESSQEVYISDIAVDSPFQDSLLRIGMQVLSINGEVPTTGWEATSLIHHQEEGYVTITALVSPATHLRTKATIGYDSAVRHRRQVGHCRQRSMEKEQQDTTRDMSSSEDIDDIEQPRVVDGPLVKVRVHKHKATAPLGLSLLRTPQGTFKVGAIDPDSKFDGTDLLVGMVVERINGIDVTGRDSVPVMRLLYDSVGNIEVEARTLDLSSCSDCRSSMSNDFAAGEEDQGTRGESTPLPPSPTTSRKPIILDERDSNKAEDPAAVDENKDDLGINVVRDAATGKYYLRDWPDDSPKTQELGLKAGMQLLTVNGVNVTGNPAKAVLAMLRKERAEDVQITVASDDDSFVLESSSSKTKRDSGNPTT